MDTEKFQELSFKATVMFSAVTLLALLAAGLFFMVPGVVIFALLSCGATYLAQMIGTLSAGESKIGIVFQVLAIAFWFVGFSIFCIGAF